MTVSPSPHGHRATPSSPTTTPPMPPILASPTDADPAERHAVRRRPGRTSPSPSAGSAHHGVTFRRVGAPRRHLLPGQRSTASPSAGSGAGFEGGVGEGGGGDGGQVVAGDDAEAAVEDLGAVGDDARVVG